MWKFIFVCEWFIVFLHIGFLFLSSKQHIPLTIHPADLDIPQHPLRAITQWKLLVYKYIKRIKQCLKNRDVNKVGQQNTLHHRHLTCEDSVVYWPVCTKPQGVYRHHVYVYSLSAVHDSTYIVRKTEQLAPSVHVHCWWH